MKLHVNGEPRELSDAQTLSEAIAKLGHNAQAVATAVNGEFVPRSRYDETRLEENDELEIVSPRQGG